MTSPYQSLTKRVSAEVFLDDATCRVGDLHLHPNTLLPGGYESLSSMMNGKEPFFPLSEDSDSVTLIGKDRTVSLFHRTADLEQEVEAVDPAAGTPGHGRVSMRVVLSDGRSISGWVALDLPSSHPRTLDVLNSAGQFFPLHEEAGIHLVSRAHIRTVHPLD